jgi:hypothetical protein
MEVREIIDGLRSSVEHIIAEDELVEVIATGLTALRRAFPSHRSLFSPSDIEFLKNLSGVSDHLRGFIDLKEESRTVRSLDECMDVLSRLTQTRDALGGLAVAKRVAKEIRELHERLPAIRDQDKLQRQCRLNMRIVDLEQKPRRCSRNHPMAIREGLRGHFWGCSKYPFCQDTAQLTPEQSHHLAS